MIYKRSFLFCFLSILLLKAGSQTCGDMNAVFSSVNSKMMARTTGKDLSGEDLAYLLAICNEATAQLDRLAKTAKDESALSTYRYDLVVIHTQIAVHFATKGLDQNVYDLLQPVNDKAAATDKSMINESSPIVCQSDHAISQPYPYTKISAGYHFLFIDAALKLGKGQEAENDFKVISKYSFGMNSQAIYDAAAAIIHYKLNKHEPDAVLVDALSTIFNTYTNWYAFDSTRLTITEAVNILNMPELVNNKDVSRAQAFYKIYYLINKYARIHSNELNFSTEVQAEMIKQAIRSLSPQSNMPEFVDILTYQPQLVQAILELKDPAILQNVIARMSDYIQEKKGNVASKVFWENLATLYSAANMTKEAEAAEKKSKKYKY